MVSFWHSTLTSLCCCHLQANLITNITFLRWTFRGRDAVAVCRPLLSRPLCPSWFLPHVLDFFTIRNYGKLNASAVHRSRPVVKVTAEVQFQGKSKLISLSDKKCQLLNHTEVACAELMYCLTYTGVNVDEQISKYYFIFTKNNTLWLRSIRRS